MAEHDLSDPSNPAVGLSIDDITPDVYEGGFKTWECAVDLATYLSGSLSKGWGLGGREVRVVEVLYALPDWLCVQPILTEIIPDRWAQAQLFQFSYSSTSFSKRRHPRGVPFIY